MRGLKWISLVLVAIAAVIGVSACGGSDKSEQAANADTTAMSDGGGNATDTTTTDHDAMATEDEAAGTPEAESPAADLRVTLDRLLGEHTLLAMFATQKGFSGDPDFKQAAAALDRNSVELSRAIASVYGDGAGKKFLDGKLLWRDHIGFFVDYTVGLAKKDKAMQREAVGNLKGYIEAFSAFLSGATELPQGALRTAISEHVMQLKGQIDAYSKGNYAQAYRFAREAYAHMFMTGDTLAGGIVAQSPDKFASS